jgi:hypothetical protein
MIRRLGFAALLVALCFSPARAGDFGLTDPARWSVSGSAAWLGFKDYGSGATTWQGVDVAPAVTFSIHQRLALAANFAHGVPFESGHGHVNVARLQGQLRIYPSGGVSGPTGLFVSAGPSWMGELSLREWSGLNTQLAVTHQLGEHVSGFVMFAHGFGWQAVDGDRDFFRVGLNVGTTLGR